MRCSIAHLHVLRVPIAHLSTSQIVSIAAFQNIQAPWEVIELEALYGVQKIIFRIRRDTQMQKLIKRFAERHGVPRTDVKIAASGSQDVFPDSHSNALVVDLVPEAAHGKRSFAIIVSDSL